jgi:hypothetical protein
MIGMMVQQLKVIKGEFKMASIKLINGVNEIMLKINYKFWD